MKDNRFLYYVARECRMINPTVNYPIYSPIVNVEDATKRFIKCSHAGHTIIITDEFTKSIPQELGAKVDLPCGCRNVDAKEILRRIKDARPYTI